MLSGFFHAAFNYLNGNVEGGSGRGVRCSTAEEEEKNTAMSSTESNRQNFLHDTMQDRQRLKSNQANQPTTTTTANTTTRTTTGLLDQLLLFDEQLTSSLGIFAHPGTPSKRAVRSLCKVLEISGHGVPWFCVCGLLLLCYLYSGNRTWLDYGWNMLIVLVADVLIVAPVKLLFKRPRPLLNIGSIPMSVSSVDNYAFPSGHASRCVALAAYFCYMPPFNPWTHLWYIWGLLVSLSRVALCRHHVLDVVAGMGAGLVIFDVVRRSGFLQGV